MARVNLALDVGKTDRSTLAAPEAVPRDVVLPDGSTRRETHFLVRHLERMPEGTSYTRVVERVREVRDWIEAMTTSGDDLRLLIDATGVGDPIVDMVRERMGRSRFKLVPIRITGTDRAERDEKHAGGFLVGHNYLVSRLQVLIEQQRVKLPATDEAQVLLDELRDFEIRDTLTGNVTSGARSGRHDDLVFAVAMGCLEFEKPHAVPSALGEVNAVGRTGSIWRGADGGSTTRRAVQGPTVEWMLPTRAQYERRLKNEEEQA